VCSFASATISPVDTAHGKQHSLALNNIPANSTLRDRKRKLSSASDAQVTLTTARQCTSDAALEGKVMGQKQTAAAT
jgi:hypothetical protein